MSSYVANLDTNVTFKVKSVTLKKLMDSFAELENVNWKNLENNSIKITAKK